MTERAPTSDGRRLTAVLVALGWGAAVVAANGFVSLITGLEVDPLRNAGPLVVPVAVVAALVALETGPILISGARCLADLDRLYGASLKRRSRELAGNARRLDYDNRQ